MATRQGLVCRARSSKTGQPCRKYAILGGTVCRVHGGSTRHVREKARERLEELVIPAISTLRRLVASAETDAVQLQAARDILDRCGFKPTDKVEQATEVVVRVSYADVGPAPPPGRSLERQNGHRALDGD